MIRALLGEPDARTRNPHYRQATEMRLYQEDRVAEAETSDDFKGRLADAAQRRARSRATAAIRRKNLIEWAENTPIDWVNAPTSAAEAVRLGIRSWETWNQDFVESAEETTRHRWARNYLPAARMPDLRGSAGRGPLQTGRERGVLDHPRTVREDDQRALPRVAPLLVATTTQPPKRRRTRAVLHPPRRGPASWPG